MEKCLIAAVADDLALGRDNDLLWHLPEDLKYFKRLTSGHPVIMGRRTFESLGRPLPKRLNIVLSRQLAANAACQPTEAGVGPQAPAACAPTPSQGSAPAAGSADPTRPVAFAATLEQAFSLAATTPFEGRCDEPDRCFVIGGGQIYAQAIACCDRLFLTRVHTRCPDADTFFPDIDTVQWKELSRSETFREGDLTYEFVEYGR